MRQRSDVDLKGVRTTSDDHEKMVSIDELAKKFKVKVPTMRRYVRELGIPKIRMGHQIVRYHYPTVRQFLHKKHAN